MLKNERNMANIGFKFGKSGAHAARSLMSEELSLLLEYFGASPIPERSKLKQLVEGENLLQKPTTSARRLTLRHLIDLYGLSDSICLFQVFRQLWRQAPLARSILTLQMALCRDPLLRSSLPILIRTNPGESITRLMVEDLLEENNPGGYSSATRQSYAQNINGSWTQSGFLIGRARKIRSQPNIDAANIAFALFVAHLDGFQGQRAFDSRWCKFLSNEPETLYQLAKIAHNREFLRYKHSGDVIEVVFPRWKYNERKEVANG